MRKVIYYLAASLDGFIARKDGSVDWLKMEDLEEAADEFAKFTNSVDTVLYGRKTFEKGLEFDPDGENSKSFTNIVFSRSQSVEYRGFATFVNEDPVSFVKNLREKAGKDIWLMGGGQLAGTLLHGKLIDEITINVQPVILGEGIPVFRNPGECLDLKTLDIKRRKSGSVEVKYQV